MKNIKIIKGCKCVTVCLLIVSILFSSTSFVTLLLTLEKEGYDIAEEAILGEDFEDTYRYYRMIEYYMDSLDAYMEIRNMLGIKSDNVLRMDQPLISYMPHPADDKNKKIPQSYTLEYFLKDMSSNSDIISQMQRERDNMASGNYYLVEVAEKCIQKWKELYNASFTINGYTYCVQKEATPKKERKVDVLYNRLRNLVKCYYFYQEMFEEESNLQYCFVDYGEEDTALRKTAEKNFDEFVERHYQASEDEKEWFALYDSANPKENKSEIPGITTDRIQYVVKQDAKEWNEGKALALAFDKEYGIDDSFGLAKNTYDVTTPILRRNVYSFVGAACVACIALLLLVIFCGRKEEVEIKGKKKMRVVLHGYEEWLSELYAIGMAGVGILFIIAAELFDDAHEILLRLSELETVFVAFIGGMVLFFCFCVITLVKKCKAGRLLKDTIVAKILAFIIKWKKKHPFLLVEKIKKFWRNFGEDEKGFPKVIFYMFMQTIFVWIAMMVPSPFTFLFWLAVSVSFAFWVIQSRLADIKILRGAQMIAGGQLDYQLEKGEKETEIRAEMIDAINHIGEGLSHAVEEQIKSERMKTELITNVSHDIKTPLTSVINYVDLLKREQIDDETVQGYIEVLDNKSQRLKVLIDDLVEASKASSGAISLVLEVLNFRELAEQTNGEFQERFGEKNLQLVCNMTEQEMLMEGDGRRTFRILENLYQNVYKYAMEGTRVYVDLQKEGKELVFTIKNISREPLQMSADELTERFVRGDASRTTEGSGLGLSIARSLTELQKGRFEIYIDGDLFRVTLHFPLEM